MPPKGWIRRVAICDFKPDEISLPGEEWRPLTCWEQFYRVSSLGRIYSLHEAGRLMTGMLGRDGYRVIQLKCRERTELGIVHRMVLETFVGPAPEGHEGCHCNGESQDNRLVNLRWDTRLANHADKRKHGTSLKGRYLPRILTAKQVIEIRTAGLPDRYFATKFGASAGAIRKARRGGTWKHLDTPPDKRPHGHHARVAARSIE